MNAELQKADFDLVEGLEPIRLNLATLDELPPAVFRFYTERLYRWTKAVVASAELPWDFAKQMDPRTVEPAEWAAATPEQRLVLLVGASQAEAEGHPCWSAWSKLQDPGPADDRPLKEWWSEVEAELVGEAFARLRTDQALDQLWNGITEALAEDFTPSGILRSLNWALGEFKHRGKKVEYPATWVLKLMRNDLCDASRRQNERT